ncbi:MAG: hypothetical protein GX587_11205 [Bacteroidales bacterium]|nr:hypothetical protein [Bacteroidales bacterium]
MRSFRQPTLVTAIETINLDKSDELLKENRLNGSKEKSNDSLNIEKTSMDSTFMVYADSIAVAEINSPIDTLALSKIGANGDGRETQVVEDLYLMTDKLLFTRTYIVYDPLFSMERKPIEMLDSIIGKTPERKKTPDISYFVEFWESPINYKGYKMGRNRIIVYGIYLPDFVTLKMYDKTVYLKYLNEYYVLEYSNEFRSFRTLKNSALIAELDSI